MAFIRADNLVKRYPSGEGSVAALKGVSLAVSRGEFLAVVGESGAGKSTLLSLLGGLDRPTEGSLSVDGIDLGSLDEERLALFRSEYLGFVFQSFQLIPYLTAVENVLLPLVIVSMPAAAKKAAAMEALARVGLADKGLRLPGQLSGGEQERVAVARAIVNTPPVLLADEPTGNLDSANGDAVMGILKGLSGEGMTVVMVTHNPAYSGWADRTARLRDGRIEAIGTALAGAGALATGGCRG